MATPDKFAANLLGLDAALVLPPSPLFLSPFLFFILMHLMYSKFHKACRSFHVHKNVDQYLCLCPSPSESQHCLVTSILFYFFIHRVQVPSTAPVRGRRSTTSFPRQRASFYPLYCPLQSSSSSLHILYAALVSSLA